MSKTDMIKPNDRNLGFRGGSFVLTKLGGGAERRSKGEMSAVWETQFKCKEHDDAEDDGNISFGNLG